MTRPSLTVVVPTRNRPDSLLRLLKSLAVQSLPPQEFEAVIVDDGSEPPLETAPVTKDMAYAIRVIRRTCRPGAHESRFAGLREARGERVLFLDDDVILQTDVLAEHAAVKESFAVGPIFYHPDARRTPYQRFASRQYEGYADILLSKDRDVPASEIYICNASGPTERFREVFEKVRTVVADGIIAGDGYDEELLNYALRNHQGAARLLPSALILHMDNKTVEQVRRERQLHGKLQCLLLLRFPEMRRIFSSYDVLTGSLGSYRLWRVRLLWIVPSVFRIVANLFTWLADRGPARWVPAWTCYPPLAIAFWEGMHSAAPSYRELRAALLAGGKGAGG